MVHLNHIDRMVHEKHFYCSDLVVLSPVYNRSVPMGVLFSSIFGRLFSKREVRILVLGLDNAGKTTILCMIPYSFHEISFVDRLQTNDVIKTTPSMYAMNLCSNLW